MSAPRWSLLPALLLSLLLVACGGGGGGDSNSSNSSVASASNSSSSSSTLSGSNVMDVDVLAFAGSGSAPPNIPYVTVTVCDSSGANCSTIPDVILDTGSSGLRLFASQLSSATLSNLPSIPLGSGNLAECALFASGYLWGGMRMATVQLGRLSTTQAIPIQLVGDANVPSAAPSSCSGTGHIGHRSSSTTLTNLGSTSVLGGNGILGVSNFLNDCGSSCAGAATLYYDTCTSTSSCSEVAVSASTVSNNAISSVGQQAINPVAALPAGYNNGVVLNLPSVASGGAASASGTMVLGTSASNSPLSVNAQTYALDSSGNLGVAVNGVSGTGFIDSGSNGYYLSNANIAALTPCSNSSYSSFYCPSSPVQLSLGLTPGVGSGASSSLSVTIGNAATLFASAFYALPELGGEAAISGEVDLGLPFFYGRPIAVGIGSLSGSYSNGFDAF